MLDVLRAGENEWRQDGYSVVQQSRELDRKVRRGEMKKSNPSGLFQLAGGSDGRPGRRNQLLLKGRL
jgi:hypothetical protein